MNLFPRSRRQVENPELAVLNISMPTVNWNREFGDANISVDLTRTVRNSYDIDTGSYNASTFVTFRVSVEYINYQ